MNEYCTPVCPSCHKTESRVVIPEGSRATIKLATGFFGGRQTRVYRFTDTVGPSITPGLGWEVVSYVKMGDEIIITELGPAVVASKPVEDGITAGDNE